MSEPKVFNSLLSLSNHIVGFSPLKKVETIGRLRWKLDGFGEGRDGLMNELIFFLKLGEFKVDCGAFGIVWVLRGLVEF